VIDGSRRRHHLAGFKRLERGNFRLPAHADGRVELTAAELAALLAGSRFGIPKPTRSRWIPVEG
jgi:transposase